MEWMGFWIGLGIAAAGLFVAMGIDAAGEHLKKGLQNAWLNFETIQPEREDE